MIGGPGEAADAVGVCVAGPAPVSPLPAPPTPGPVLSHGLSIPAPLSCFVLVAASPGSGVSSAQQLQVGTTATCSHIPPPKKAHAVCVPALLPGFSQTSN